MKSFFYGIALLWTISTQADTYVVTSTADSNVCNITTCTLRGAINLAVTNTGIDTINFNIPADAVNQNYFAGGSGQDAYFYWLIQPSSELPELIEIILDGTSAGTSVAGNPTIVIDGSLAGTGTTQNPVDGLTLTGRVTVTGVAMIYWDEAGLRIADGSNSTVRDSWFGLNLPYGLAAAPNRVGIGYEAQGNNSILGVFNATGNVISGNSQYGIETISSSSGLNIFGNMIGTDPSGDVAVPNDGLGVYIQGLNHRVGSSSIPLSGNLISGNISNGIQVSGYPLDTDSGHVIEGNIIGLNRTGDAEIPNQIGIYIQRGQDFTVQHNTIAGNNWYGIEVTSEPEDVLISNNKIGVNFSGQPFSTGTGIKANGGATRLIIGPDNEIAHGNIGVSVGQQSTGQVSVRQNQIHDNFRIGIDLKVDDFTANDAGDFDAGPNRLQNFPDISTAQYDSSGNRIHISFQVDSQIGTSEYPMTIDVYAADGDGEEGEAWLASTTYTAAEYIAGLPVNKTLIAAVPVAEGDLIVTTATDAAGRTSEFSPSFTLGGEADFSISCQTNQLTTDSKLTCSLNCQAEAVNGWGDEAQLSCSNTDSSCNFLPSDEISFSSPEVPFVLEINHNASVPGIYASEILASSEVQGGTVERQEILTIKQLADGDYIFKDGFDGIICQ